MKNAASVAIDCFLHSDVERSRRLQDLTEIQGRGCVVTAAWPRLMVSFAGPWHSTLGKRGCEIHVVGK